MALVAAVAKQALFTVVADMPLVAAVHDQCSGRSSKRALFKELPLPEV